MSEVGVKASESVSTHGNSAAPTYSVVVPVYKSALSLVELTERLDRVFRLEIGESHEFIFVDDGSPTPETWETLLELSARFPSVRAFQLTRNFGKGGAVICGFSQVRGSWVITMDDDLQHCPEDIPKLLELKHHDVVMGAFGRRHHGFVTKTGSWLSGWLSERVLGQPRGIRVSPFRMYRVEIVRAMIRLRTPHPYLPALMFFVTKDVVSVEVQHEERKHGAPSFTLFRRVQLFTNLLINNSAFLLQVIASVGLLMLMFSLGYSAYLVARFFSVGAVVPGWTAIMVAVLVIGGFTLFGVGVIGEYLIRIINGIEMRPPFVLRKSTVPEPLLPEEGSVRA